MDSSKYFCKNLNIFIATVTNTKLKTKYLMFFKCHLKVGVEESIVNAPLLSLQSKNTNNAKSEVSFKQLIRDL
jgi:hypothetical protein